MGVDNVIWHLSSGLPALIFMNIMTYYDCIVLESLQSIEQSSCLLPLRDHRPWARAMPTAADESLAERPYRRWKSVYVLLLVQLHREQTAPMRVLPANHPFSPSTTGRLKSPQVRRLGPQFKIFYIQHRSLYGSSCARVCLESSIHYFGHCYHRLFL